MNEIEKRVRIPPQLTKRDAKLLEELDACETITTWAAHRVRHKTTIEWNAFREPFVLHPSAADNPCDFFLYMQLVGGKEEREIPPATQLIFDTGTAIHAQLQHYMETRADFHKYQYASEVGFSGKNSANASALKMAGHVDGLSRGWPLKDAPLVWEFKTINRAGFERLTSPHSAYIKQVHLYMLAVEAPAAIILYICKDNSQLHQFKIPLNPDIWRPMLSRLLYIRDCAKKMEGPERRVSSACKRCKFRDECEPDLSKVSDIRGRLPRRL